MLVKEALKRWTGQQCYRECTQDTEKKMGRNLIDETKGEEAGINGNFRN